VPLKVHTTVSPGWMTPARMTNGLPFLVQVTSPAMDAGGLPSPLMSSVIELTVIGSWAFESFLMATL